MPGTRDTITLCERTCSVESSIRNAEALRKMAAHVNRKQWWHVPPADPNAYGKRGIFYASSFSEAEFYGRPLDEPQKVKVRNPLVGDGVEIGRMLEIPEQHEGMTLEEIAAHDAKWRNAALALGFDAIVHMAPQSFSEFKRSGKIPRKLELNILNPGHNGDGKVGKRGTGTR